MVLLFDIDGTLLMAPKLGRVHFESAMQAQCGAELSTEGVRFAGRTDRSLARELLGMAGIAEPDHVMDRVLEDYAARFEAAIRPQDVEVLPGVRALLDRLGGHDHLSLGLLTGNVERTGWAKLRAADLHGRFGFGAFGSDHEDRNELPRFARDRAARSLGRDVTFGELVVIGDTAHDVACGKAVGAVTVGVCTGYVSRQSLVEAGPDLLLEDFTRPDTLLDLVGA
ncbi:MAG: HAD hydrolase-like protein [Rhodothermales bacterium]|nr:HAD hydrolase-like protein [Rhodothermales bacterium]MBO6779730.1 HAD hydrolase-like protein [Rhodothermales bacterium]